MDLQPWLDCIPDVEVQTNLMISPVISLGMMDLLSLMSRSVAAVSGRWTAPSLLSATTAAAAFCRVPWLAAVSSWLTSLASQYSSNPTPTEVSFNNPGFDKFNEVEDQEIAQPRRYQCENVNHEPRQEDSVMLPPAALKSPLPV